MVRRVARSAVSLVVLLSVAIAAGPVSAQSYNDRSYNQNSRDDSYRDRDSRDRDYRDSRDRDSRDRDSRDRDDRDRDARDRDRDRGYGDRAYNDRQSCDRGLFTNQNVGTALGAAVGGLLASQLGRGSGKTVATIAGVVGGGFLGNQVGSGMDQGDQGCMAQTLDQAPPGRTVTWRNPDSNRDYHVTPRDEFTRNGRRCRNVESEAYIDGRREYVTNVACRRKDGSWEFDN